MFETFAVKKILRTWKIKQGGGSLQDRLDTLEATGAAAEKATLRAERAIRVRSLMAHPGFSHMTEVLGQIVERTHKEALSGGQDDFLRYKTVVAVCNEIMGKLNAMASEASKGGGG